MSRINNTIMLSLVLYLFVIVILVARPINSAKRCVSDQKPPEYHLIKKCHKSTQNIIAGANYVSLVSCQKLALEKKGLAINFSPPEMRKAETGSEEDSSEDGRHYSCEVLKCPESEIGLSLDNDTSFDYYSLYADPLPNPNATCIPGIGMFSLEHEKLNYSQAIIDCNKKHGALADPTTDGRTDDIAQLLMDGNVDLAYVGLKSTNGSHFVSSSGQQLECTTYRAWAPGHPKTKSKTHDCVVVDKQKTWKTVKCNAHLPFVCELYPGGPYVPGSLNKTVTNVTLETSTSEH